MPSSTKAHLRTIFEAGLRAVDPERAVSDHLHREGDRLTVDGRDYDLARYRRVFLVGAGKGTAPMARAVENMLGDTLSAGLIVVKVGHGLELNRTRIIEAAHPIPDADGVRGANEVLELLQRAGPEDLVIVALSGGGSALLPAPRPPVELHHKQEVTRMLLECGATIGEINGLRKHLSLSKGGRLAQAAHPATVVTLILSDVIGDPPDVIASGPTVADPSTFGDCLEIVDCHALRERLPPSVLQVLTRGAAGAIPETPKAGDPVLAKVHNVIVGGNRAALAAARDEARRLGYRTLVLSSQIEGEAREVAKVLTAVAKEIDDSAEPLPPPACILAGGETTVTLRGDGRGGRNQELALAAALALDGRTRIGLLSAGTDGTDGPTDAAGAFADGFTCQRARRTGLDARKHLQRNDAYTFFESLGDLLITGPTRTNVMDLILMIVSPAPEAPGVTSGE